MTFRVNRVESWGSLLAVGGPHQVIVYLEDEATGATERENGTNYCVRLTLPELPGVITALLDAYRQGMETVAIDLACGGCRACKNTRVGPDSEPCPVCWPRGEARLRDKVVVAHMGRPR